MEILYYIHINGHSSLSNMNEFKLIHIGVELIFNKIFLNCSN